MADETTLTPERIAHAFHDAYEALAPAFGYRTREASSKPWEQIPASNRDLMIATVRAVFYERDGAFFVCGPSAPIAAAPVLSFDDALRIARGCLDYRGGCSDDALTADARDLESDAERVLEAAISALAAQVETLTRERDEAIRQRDEARRERDHAGDILAIVRRQPLVLR